MSFVWVQFCGDFRPSTDTQGCMTLVIKYGTALWPCIQKHIHSLQFGTYVREVLYVLSVCPLRLDSLRNEKTVVLGERGTKHKGCHKNLGGPCFCAQKSISIEILY